MRRGRPRVSAWGRVGHRCCLSTRLWLLLRAYSYMPLLLPDEGLSVNTPPVLRPRSEAHPCADIPFFCCLCTHSRAPDLLSTAWAVAMPTLGVGILLGCLLHAVAGFSIVPSAARHRLTASPRAAVPCMSDDAKDTEQALLALLSTNSGRGKTLSPIEVEKVHELAMELEASSQNQDDTNDSPLLPGRWRVLYQGKPGTTTPFFSVESWQKYLSGDGPSPIQNLVSGSGSVSRLYQVVQFGDDARSTGRILNVVDASPAAVVAIEADLDGKPEANRLGFRFSGGSILLRTLWNGTLALPYPVPFDLLGDNAKGWLQTNYLTGSLRLSRGNKGSLFVLAPEPEPDDPELEALLEPPPPPSPPVSASSLTKDPVIVCPAQFGTLSDYQELVDELQARGHPTVVAPLAFTDWLRLIPASLTKEYWTGELSPDVALPFYYEALDKATAQLAEQYPGKKVQLVAHSIGGWIARAYLGQLPAAKRESTFSALVTLGTPHTPPPEGIFRTIDQTRGLLMFVEDRYPGHGNFRDYRRRAAAETSAFTRCLRCFLRGKEDEENLREELKELGFTPTEIKGATWAPQTSRCTRSKSWARRSGTMAWRPWTAPTWTGFSPNSVTTWARASASSRRRSRWFTRVTPRALGARGYCCSRSPFGASTGRGTTSGRSPAARSSASSCLESRSSARSSRSRLASCRWRRFATARSGRP